MPSRQKTDQHGVSFLKCQQDLRRRGKELFPSVSAVFICISFAYSFVCPPHWLRFLHVPQECMCWKLGFQCGITEFLETSERGLGDKSLGAAPQKELILFSWNEFAVREQAHHCERSSLTPATLLWLLVSPGDLSPSSAYPWQHAIHAF